jgi:hypothetical protein
MVGGFLEGPLAIHLIHIGTKVKTKPENDDIELLRTPSDCTANCTTSRHIVSSTMGSFPLVLLLLAP